MIEGEQIEFFQGGGKFRRRREGVVDSILENGKLLVSFQVGGEETKALVSVSDIVAEEKIVEKAPRQLSLFEPVPPMDDVLHDDITVETIIEPVMYRADILGPKPGYRTIQRHHVGDSRYYVQQFQNQDGEWSRPELYAGVTSVCGKVLPRSKHIEEWMCQFGSYEAAQRELDKLASRGTVMHSLFAMCMNDELPDFGTSEFERVLRGLIARQENVDVDEVFPEWKSFFCKALLGFKQFMYDHNVEPLAVEMVLGQPTERREDGSKPLYGYFAQIDLLCYMDYEVKGEWGEVYKSGPRKGKPKLTYKSIRVLAIVDFKSGTGDHPEHDLQLMLQVPLVRLAFPNLDTKEVMIFNWHPTDFRMSALAKKHGAGEPESDEESEKPELEFGYSLLDKTGKYPRSWAEDHLWMWQKYHARELPLKAVYQNSPNIGTKPSENLKFMDYATYWEEKVEKARHRGFLEMM